MTSRGRTSETPRRRARLRTPQSAERVLARVMRDAGIRTIEQARNRQHTTRSGRVFRQTPPSGNANIIQAVTPLNPSNMVSPVGRINFDEEPTNPYPDTQVSYTPPDRRVAQESPPDSPFHVNYANADVPGQTVGATPRLVLNAIRNNFGALVAGGIAVALGGGDDGGDPDDPAEPEEKGGKKRKKEMKARPMRRQLGMPNTPGAVARMEGGGDGPGAQAPFASAIYQGNLAAFDDLPDSGAPVVAKPRRGTVRVSAFAPLVRVPRGLGRHAIDPNSGFPFSGVNRSSVKSLQRGMRSRGPQVVF